MADAVACATMGLSLFLMLWIVQRLHPRSAARPLALLGPACATLAVGFFWAYQWAGYTVLAYIDGITFGLFAVQAALLLWLKWLAPEGSSGRQRTSERGLEAGGGKADDRRLRPN
jgi:hypothetical protein